jgi:hypothetical protein
MSSEAPIKTCFLKGQLKNNDQEYLYFNLCEKNVDISHGVWHLCITNCCFDMKETNGVFCGVSCNLIKELKFSDSNEIQSYFPSIACFFLKGQKIVYLEKTWFTINNQSNQLRLFFTNLDTNKKIQSDCFIYISLLLQRVK